MPGGTAAGDDWRECNGHCQDISERTQPGCTLAEGLSIDGAQVFVKKVGNAVVLLPYQGGRQTLFDSRN